MKKISVFIALLAGLLFISSWFPAKAEWSEQEKAAFLAEIRGYGAHPLLKPLRERIGGGWDIYVFETIESMKEEVPLLIDRYGVWKVAERLSDLSDTHIGFFWRSSQTAFFAYMRSSDVTPEKRQRNVAHEYMHALDLLSLKVSGSSDSKRYSVKTLLPVKRHHSYGASGTTRKFYTSTNII